MTEVDRGVAHRLARQVVRDGEDLQPVAIQYLAASTQVGVVLVGAAQVEMVARHAISRPS